jgi:hypothetical protein
MINHTQFSQVCDHDWFITPALYSTVGHYGVCLINTVCLKLALFLSQDYADICYWHYGFLSYDTVASVLEEHTNSTFHPED